MRAGGDEQVTQKSPTKKKEKKRIKQLLVDASPLPPKKRLEKIISCEENNCATAADLIVSDEFNVVLSQII